MTAPEEAFPHPSERRGGGGTVGGVGNGFQLLLTLHLLCVIGGFGYLGYTGFTLLVGRRRGAAVGTLEVTLQVSVLAELLVYGALMLGWRPSDRAGRGARPDMGLPCRVPTPERRVRIAVMAVSFSCCTACEDVSPPQRTTRRTPPFGQAPGRRRPRAAPSSWSSVAPEGVPSAV